MKRKNIFILLLSSVLVGLQGIHAQTTWTLKQCIDYAIEHNITVQQLQINSENQEIRLNTARNSRLPNLNINLGENVSFGRGAGRDDRIVDNLFYQMTRITKERGALKHDDRLDALAMACACWVDAVAQDADRMARELEEEKLEKTLEEFVEFASSPDAFTLFDPGKACDNPIGRTFF